MRTVSFSSEPVRETLRQKFICTYINTEGDPSAGSSIGHAPSDSAGQCTRGIGKQNVQCLFLTPQGNIFHAASGFRDSEELHKELDFALNTFKAVQKKPSASPQIVRDLHIERLKQQGFDDNVINSKPSPFDTVAALQDTIGRHAFRKQSSPFDAVNRVFAAKGRNAELADGRFAIQHPMMPIRKLLENPSVLVGNEKTAFSSVGNGGASGGRIGK